MKKNKFVCLSQRSKIKKTLMINQVFSLSSSLRIKFRGAGESADQVSRGWEFRQSGNFGVPVSSNQFFWSRESRQSDGRTAFYNIRKGALLLSSPRSMACGKGTSVWANILKHDSGLPWVAPRRGADERLVASSAASKRICFREES
jgi:hypothetical protein